MFDLSLCVKIGRISPSPGTRRALWDFSDSLGVSRTPAGAWVGGLLAIAPVLSKAALL